MPLNLTLRHTLTGVWVEMTSDDIIRHYDVTGHTLTGVWVEICRKASDCFNYYKSHPHGCVSWNPSRAVTRSLYRHVTPSRVCELKLLRMKKFSQEAVVTPSRVCELKFHMRHLPDARCSVTPSRVCELKCTKHLAGWCKLWVTPSRVCELKLFSLSDASGRWCHTLTGVWVEIWVAEVYCEMGAESHPHGCVSWNISALIETILSNVTPSRVCELK